MSVAALSPMDAGAPDYRLVRSGWRTHFANPAIERHLLLAPRGKLEIKGPGLLATAWLVGVASPS